MRELEGVQGDTGASSRSALLTPAQDYWAVSNSASFLVGSMPGTAGDASHR